MITDPQEYHNDNRTRKVSQW